MRLFPYVVCACYIGFFAHLSFAQDQNRNAFQVVDSTVLSASASSSEETLKKAIQKAELTIANAQNSEQNKNRRLQEVRDARRELVQELRNVKSLVETLRQTRRDIDNKRSVIEATSAIGDVSPEELSAQIQMYKILVIDHQINVDRAKEELKGAMDAGKEAYLRKEQAELESAKATLAKFEKHAGATLGSRIEELTSAYGFVSSLLVKLEPPIARADNVVQGMDDMADRLLETETALNRYAVYSTVVFGILVGGVIAGFFGIAWRSEKISNEIFSSDSGIQFVTLFSLVIAIILFGVLKILEGKELAALLGGLSGYILGRGAKTAVVVADDKKAPVS